MEADSIPGAARRPDGLFDVTLAGVYGPWPAGHVLEGVDRLEALAIAAYLKKAAQPSGKRPVEQEGGDSAKKEGTDG